MADRKYVRIPAKDLPDVFYLNGTGNVYFARYRIVSDDSRLVSKWSQKFEVPSGVTGTDIALNSDEWNASKTPTVLSVTWNVDRLFADKKIFSNRFHVYVRFYTNATNDIAKWTFMQETSARNFTTPMAAGTNKADVMVLIPTYRGLDATTVSPDSPATLFPESVLFVGLNV